MKQLELDNFIESVNNNEPLTNKQVNEFLEQISYDFTEPFPDLILRVHDDEQFNKEGVTYLDNPYNDSNKDLLIVDAFFEISKQDISDKTSEISFADMLECYSKALYFMNNYKFKMKRKYMKHVINVMSGHFKLD